MNEALAKLPEKEGMVLRLRMGIDTDRPMTLAEVAQILGISRQRAHQLENKALRRIRRNGALRGELEAIWKHLH